MDDIELTKLFVEYATLQKQLAAVKESIEKEVLLRGESVKIAGVEAKYYKPSNYTPDYEKVARSYMETKKIPDAFLEKFTTITKTVRWKDVCDDFMIAPPPGEEKPARVVLK